MNLDKMMQWVGIYLKRSGCWLALMLQVNS